MTRSSPCSAAPASEAHGLNPGDKVWLGWSPTAALLLGPAEDGSGGSRPPSQSKCRPDPRKEADADGRPTRRAQHPGAERAGARGAAHGHAPPGAVRRRRRGDGRLRRRLRRIDAAAASPAARAGAAASDEASAEKPPTPADGKVEDGDLLLANWVDYSDPANYKGYAKEYGPNVKVSGFGSNDEILAKLRAGGSKYDVISPTGYAVKTMVGPRADHAAHARADPEPVEPLARVHQDRLRPRQQVLGAEGLRHHELLLADRQGLGEARRRSRRRSTCSRRPR